MTDLSLDDRAVLTRRSFLAGAGALTVIVTTGCSGSTKQSTAAKPRRGGTLHVARYEAIDGFKLDSQTANTTYQVSQAVMEPLLRWNPDGKTVTPGLAEHFSYDAQTHSVKLRLAAGGRFSNGKPVTPADIAFSVDLWKSGPNYGSIYKAIKSVKAVDGGTVRLLLESPNGSMPAFLTWSIAGIVPKDFGGVKEEAFWQRPVGAGPYVVDRWETAGDIVLSRNPHFYRRGRPYLDRIVNSLNPDPNQRVLEFKSNQVDAVDGIAPPQAGGFTKDRRVEAPVHFTDVLIFNTKHPPLGDVRARRAFALAVDYNGIANGLYKGLATPPSGFLPPNVGLWAPPSKPYFRQDLATARQLIAETGLKAQPFELVYPTEAGFGLVAQAVQRNLQAVGLNVKLAATETGTFLDRAFGGKFQLAIWGYNAISPDIADPVSFILSTNYFFSGHPPKELQAALTAYDAATGDSEKQAQVARIQDQGEQAIPFVALDHFRVTTAVQADTGGIKPSPWGSYYYDEVWKG